MYTKKTSEIVSLLMMKKAAHRFLQRVSVRGGGDGGQRRWDLRPRLPLAALGRPVSQPQHLKTVGRAVGLPCLYAWVSLAISLR